MIRYLKKYTVEEFNKELDIFLDQNKSKEADCEACYGFGYLEVSTSSIYDTEVQACEECNYIHHIE